MPEDRETMDSRIINLASEPPRQDIEPPQASRAAGNGPGVRGDDWGPTCREQVPVLIAPGEYVARCVHAERYVHPQFKRLIGCLHLVVVEGVARGATLKRFYALANEISPNSAYAREWVIANGGKKPRRSDRLPLRLFEDKMFRIEVQTVIFDRTGEALDDHLQYSKVARILGLLSTDNGGR